MGKVLVVDDSNAIRQLVSRTLLNSGFDVESAVDGADGLRSAEACDYDLVITDINMPQMDGLNLISNLRKMPSYRMKPILVLSTEYSPEMKKRGKEAGATGWLVKPFNPDTLLDVIGKVLPAG